MEQIIKEKVKNTLRNSLRKKFLEYKPESSNMPFHYRLLGKDRMVLYSFIQSLVTTFGTSIYEPVAKTLAENYFKTVELQTKAGRFIATQAFYEINNIMTNLSTGSISPQKVEEIERIRKVSRSGDPVQVKSTKVDLKLISHQDHIYLIDIKSAKPNMGENKGFKRTLLEWVAAELYENPTANISTLIAIPYNPYEPDEYDRWTMVGMLDIKNEVKVAKEFWDFLGGSGSYEKLLDCFEEVGIELRSEIDIHFSKFRQN